MPIVWVTFGIKLLSSITEKEIYSFLNYLYATERHRQAGNFENAQFSFESPRRESFFWPFVTLVRVASHILGTAVLETSLPADQNPNMALRYFSRPRPKTSEQHLWLLMARNARTEESKIIPGHGRWKSPGGGQGPLLGFWNLLLGYWFFTLVSGLVKMMKFRYCCVPPRTKILATPLQKTLLSHPGKKSSRRPCSTSLTIKASQLRCFRNDCSPAARSHVLSVHSGGSVSNTSRRKDGMTFGRSSSNSLSHRSSYPVALYRSVLRPGWARSTSSIRSSQLFSGSSLHAKYSR